jgi:hypothetical protein
MRDHIFRPLVNRGLDCDDKGIAFTFPAGAPTNNTARSVPTPPVGGPMSAVALAGSLKAGADTGLAGAHRIEIVCAVAEQCMMWPLLRVGYLIGRNDYDTRGDRGGLPTQNQVRCASLCVSAWRDV